MILLYSVLRDVLLSVQNCWKAGIGTPAISKQFPSHKTLSNPSLGLQTIQFDSQH
jgi:hypothetical protein